MFYRRELAMKQIGFRYCICIADFMISYMLLDNFLEPKNTKRFLKGAVIAVSAMLLLAVNSLQSNFLVNGVTSLLLLFLGSRLLHSGQFSKRLFIALISVTIGYLAEVITGFGGMLMLPNSQWGHVQLYPTFFGLLMITSKLLQFAGANIVITLIPNRHRELEIRETRALIFFPILSILTLFLLNYLDMGRETRRFEHFAVIVVSLGWLVLNLVLMRVYSAALEKHDLKNQLRITQLQAQAEADFFRQQRNNEQVLRRIMHDVKNQLINAWAIADEGPEQVKAYLHELIGIYDVSDKLAITTDYQNKVFNFILNKYDVQCRQQGISLDIKIHHQDFSFLSFGDTSRMLDNAFENAVNACLQVHDRPRAIWFCAYSQNDILHMTLRNTKAGEIKIQDGLPLTSNPDPSRHGFGMGNMKQAAQRYDGAVSVEVTEDEFYLIITLNMNKS